MFLNGERNPDAEPNPEPRTVNRNPEPRTSNPEPQVAM